ncbi:Nramp family divalent metal transporter [Billgrantia diversa]|uniref:Nramp family divalent metal transporter n=1 Tax=Halomonas sp. MCCC 1A13316 TaxID=2733487 RepID=UPI0018A379B0|nr:Nramp family divalent metal transporter [Halomonas sp. MCCC 1A13316]QOR40833.1 Nramp family divalent metal transporter [Halomonas sp. MCCC 1A13316]
MQQEQNAHFRDRVPDPPKGKGRIKWYGPGLLWMLSAVGTGSILFTPRVASAYEYQLLWILLLVVLFMWVMIREMARYSIVTGRTMLEGMHTLKGPKNWAVWVIFVPQLLAAAIGIAGLAAVVGSALGEFLPGANTLYAMAMVVASTLFTATGRYSLIETFSRVMALALMVMAIVTAVIVFPGLAPIAQGLAPTWPDDPDLYVILPWVGTILAGSMGIVWFGYWTATRGFGGGLQSREPNDEMPEDSRKEMSRTAPKPQETRIDHLQQWIRTMTMTAVLGVVGGLVVIFSFLVLGAELLAPEGIMPEGPKVAVDLTNIFSDVWGEVGRYVLLAAIVIALGGSILANQDGWGRSFADMTLIVTRRHRESGSSSLLLKSLNALDRRLPWPMFERRWLKRLYIVSVTGFVPLLILLVFSDPVQVMSVSGIIAAAHTPFIALAALYVNRTRLPSQLRPGGLATLTMTAAGLFYFGFAVLYLLNMVGIIGN